MKTLEQAIGCWTTNKQYNSLPVLCRRVLDTATRCSRITKRNKKLEILLEELDLLIKQINTLLKLAEDTRNRCMKIITTDELQKG